MSRLAPAYCRWGVKSDDVEGVKWCIKAAQQECADAQFNAGVYHEQGRGGLKQDDAAATKWYEKAVANGYARITLRS